MTMSLPPSRPWPELLEAENRRLSHPPSKRERCGTSTYQSARGCLWLTITDTRTSA